MMRRVVKNHCKQRAVCASYPVAAGPSIHFFFF
jgi:hypothetical protein